MSTIIHCKTFIQNTETLQGCYPLSLFPRLREFPQSEETSVNWTLEGYISPMTKTPCILLKIEGKMFLSCTRCTESMIFLLNTEQEFQHVENESDIVDDDNLEFLSEEFIDIQNLIEEEILLLLPYAPKHENCQLNLSQSTDDKENAFAILKKLLSD